MTGKASRASRPIFWPTFGSAEAGYEKIRLAASRHSERNMRFHMGKPQIVETASHARSCAGELAEMGRNGVDPPAGAVDAAATSAANRCLGSRPWPAPDACRPGADAGHDTHGFCQGAEGQTRQLGKAGQFDDGRVERTDRRIAGVIADLRGHHQRADLAHAQIEEPAAIERVIVRLAD